MESWSKKSTKIENERKMSRQSKRNKDSQLILGLVTQEGTVSTSKWHCHDFVL